MAGDQKKRTFDITEPTSIAKLAGVQVAVKQLEELALTTRRAIPEKRGVISACRVLAKRIFDECVPINAEVQSGKMEPDEAKIRIDEVKRISKIVAEVGDRNTEDIKRMEGEVEGQKKAAEFLAKTYEEMALKYERHERIERENDETAEDEEDRRAPEPPPPPVEKDEAEVSPEPEKKPAKKPKKKAALKAPKGKVKQKDGQDS